MILISYLTGKGKEKELYPNPKGLDLPEDYCEQMSMVLMQFFSKLDARQGDILQNMLDKELAKLKKKADPDSSKEPIKTVGDLYTHEKVIIITDAQGEEIHLAKTDFNHLKECIEISDGLYFETQSQRNWIEKVCDKWRILEFEFDHDVNDIACYGGMKSYCNKVAGMRFENKVFDFLQISTERFVEMRNKYNSFKSKLAAAVWKHKLGVNIDLPMYEGIDVTKSIEEEFGVDEFGLALLKKLKIDVKRSAIYLSDDQARFLVDLYYQIQRYRITANNQCRTLDSVPENEPHELLSLFADNFQVMERNIKSCLEVYAASKPIGKWMLSICGIGPVITAGIMANVDISKVNTAGAIQRYAGLDPTLPKAKKGEKRRYNARLKVLCWKIGESFLKTCNREDDFYGKYFKIRMDYETRKDAAGDYAEQAKKIPEEKNFTKKDVEAVYLKGHLPKSHIISRSKRYAVKLFLSHLFTVWYELDRGFEPPKPFPIAILGHTHEIKVPNWDSDVKVLIKELGLDKWIDTSKKKSGDK